MLNIGDFEFQVSLTELLFRMFTNKVERESAMQTLINNSMLKNKLKQIDGASFESVCIYKTMSYFFHDK